MSKEGIDNFNFAFTPRIANSKQAEGFGFPMIVAEEVPKGTVILGPSLPSQQQIIDDGCTTLEEWIHERAKEFAMIKNVGDE